MAVLLFIGFGFWMLASARANFRAGTGTMLWSWSTEISRYPRAEMPSRFWCVVGSKLLLALLAFGAVIFAMASEKI